MLRTIGTMSVVLFTAGCSMFGAKEEPIPVSAPRGAVSPQLWSGHKEIDLRHAICPDRAFNTLKALGYTDIVKDSDSASGNFSGNRAEVKCVADSRKSFVYFAVAGADKDVVEKLRNDIAQRL